MLTLAEVRCDYGDAPVLHGVSLTLAPGQVLCLLGRNGAGKTTTLRTIMGLLRPRSGSISVDGREITGIPPHHIPRHGLAYVPQGRGLFPSLTVAEHLRIGLLAAGGARGDRGGVAGAADAGTRTEAPGWIFDLFPPLRARLGQRAGTLSGGEQQMVATARALCAAPRYLLMDEPTEGLMPALIQTLLDAVRWLAAREVGVLLVEQKVAAALRVADAVALMEDGRIAYRGAPAELSAAPEVLERHLGVRRSGRTPP